jgi:hypothetical protein
MGEGESGGNRKGKVSIETRENEWRERKRTNIERREESSVEGRKQGKSTYRGDKKEERIR